MNVHIQKNRKGGASVELKALSQVIGAMRVVASSTPRFATFFVNTWCNRRCVYCVVPEQGSGTELSPETWRQITDRVTSWGVRFVNILGGEPTLRKDLPAIVELISMKAVVSLTSNGDTFVGDKGKERLRVLSQGGLSILNLSLHDLRETERQLNILQFAQRIGLIPILATMVTRATITHLPDVMRMANKRGVFYRYSLYQDVGGAFSSAVNGLSPTPEQLSAFVATVRKQQSKTHLIQNTTSYMTQSTNVYPRGWHCDTTRDHWVVVDNEGRLMVCSEYPTSVKVLEIPSLNDAQWVGARTEKRKACSGCTYQCYMDEELGRRELILGAVEATRGLLQSRGRQVP
jgi:MoaA/NifB/PqqE/SkfB family radical SAM enzyme